jgi:hypothetical protein
MSRTRSTTTTAALLAVAVVPLWVMAPSGATTTDDAVAAHPHRPAAASYLTAWDAIGSDALTASGLGPIEGHVIFAYTAIAEYDAVMAVRRTYRPFAVEAEAPRRTSVRAAVAAAAHRVLSHHLPGQVATILDPAYRDSLATIADGVAKANGVALGEHVADALIALRQDDGFRAPVVYTPPASPLPGDWLPTVAAPPAAVYAGLMRPFALRSADQFRPAGPPALDSARWARDYNETKAVGSATSSTRTDEQTLAARFWAEAPVQQAHGAFRRFLEDHQLGAARAARFLAMVSVAFADGLIACFDAKYTYTFWRPITAIRAGDTDPNPATVGDPTWTPLLPVTPNHPEYPSAHSCATPAAGLVMERVLGTSRIDATFPSLTGLGDRHFRTPRDLAREVANARVWGGIHFRSAVEDGARIARMTAHVVLDHHFQRWHH